MTLLQTSSGLDTTNRLTWSTKVALSHRNPPLTRPRLRPGAGQSWRSAATGPGGSRRSSRPTDGLLPWRPPPRPRRRSPIDSRSCHRRSRLTSGLLHVSNGCLQQAVTAFTRGTRARASPAGARRLPRHAWPTSRPFRVICAAPAATPALAAHAQRRRRRRRARPAGEGLDRPGARGLRGDAPTPRPVVRVRPSGPRPLVGREPAAGRGTTARGNGSARRRDSSAGGGLRARVRGPDLGLVVRPGDHRPCRGAAGVGRTAAGPGPRDAPAGARGGGGQRRGGGRSPEHRRRRGAQAVLARAVAGLESAPLALADPGVAARVAARRGPRASTSGPGSCWIVPSGWPPQSRCDGR